jgi:hypothetical protein
MKLFNNFNDFLNESLRSDLKKFINKNEDELNKLADEDQWDRINLMLTDHFGVEVGSKEAKEIIDAFMLTF